MTKKDVLKKYFGYDQFRFGQEELIDAILHGQDVLAIMPTGSGKSICYQVPALMFSGITIVISPLISLMKDQVQSLNQNGVHAAFINSSLTETQIKKALSYASAGQYKIIYVAPERLETYDFIEFARNAPISMVTIDEAHCVSQWGQDFRPSYLKIMEFIECLPNRPVVSAFTATATTKVKEDMLSILKLQHPKVVVTGFDRPNLYFGVEKPKNKEAYIINYVKEHQTESGIIYCATRKNVDAVTDWLEQEGILVTKYHAGLSNEVRKQNQDDFIYDRKPVIVATNAFGMGIDKSNVRYVLHYNMPQSLENYYQEAGRAGRDGQPSECILLYEPKDVVINRFLLDSKEGSSDSYEARNLMREQDEQRLKQMTFYCFTTECLREYILHYFGEKKPFRCENCSNCHREFEEQNRTEEAKIIIQCVMELNQRYGINMIVGTLLGGTTTKLKQYAVQQYETFAALKHLKEVEMKQIIHQMIMDQVLFLTEDKYSILKLGSHANDVLNGQKDVIVKAAQLTEEEKKKNQTKAFKKGTSTKQLTERGLELFERLRSIRTKLAKEQGVPPYVVCSDQTLVDMCVITPLTAEEMLQVNGIGESKVKKYGNVFLTELKQFTNGTKEVFAIQQEDVPIEKGRTIRRGKKEEFQLTKEMAANIKYSEKGLLSELVNQLNDLRNEEVMKKLTQVSIRKWLIKEGFIKEVVTEGRTRFVVLEQGKKVGISVGTHMSEKGNEYEVLFYQEQAQRMIVTHLVSGLK